MLRIFSDIFCFNQNMQIVLKVMPVCFTLLTSTVCLQNHSASVSECQWMPFFPHGGIQFHSSASYTLPCSTPFCRTVPLLPSVTWQQNLREYWWEGSTSTAVPPTSASDIMCQHCSKGGISFGTALIHSLLGIWVFSASVQYVGQVRLKSPGREGAEQTMCFQSQTHSGNTVYICRYLDHLCCYGTPWSTYSVIITLAVHVSPKTHVRCSGIRQSILSVCLAGLLQATSRPFSTHTTAHCSPHISKIFCFIS